MTKRMPVYLSFILLLITACKNDVIQSTKENVVRVRVMDISQEDVKISVHASGILASEQEVKLSFKTGGIVAAVNVREGDRVKKDDILAVLNLSEINANAELARNGYEKAMRDWTRAKSLYEDTVATLEQFQNATSALNAAKANLEIAGFNLRHSTIRAPSGGTILKQLIRENELVAPGYPVFLFGSGTNLWKVRTGISDKDVVRIYPGDSAVVTLDAWPGVRFAAVVDQVSSLANPVTGTFETELILNDTGYRLASGFIAGVDIYPSEQRSYFLLPAGAIVDAEGRTGFIYSVTDSSTAVRYQVSIEALQGSEIALTGIPEGVKNIITEGAAYVKDGMKVKVVK